MKKLGKILAVGAAGAAAAAVVNAGRKKAEAETRRIADEEVKSRDYGERKVYLVGGGLASLAAAAYLVRDCSFPGENITICGKCKKHSCCHANDADFQFRRRFAGLGMVCACVAC